METHPPTIWTQAKEVAKFLSVDTYDGIQFGTKRKRTEPIGQASRGHLVTWNRSDHARYAVEEVSPFKALALGKDAHWEQNSHLLYYTATFGMRMKTIIQRTSRRNPVRTPMCP